MNQNPTDESREFISAVVAILRQGEGLLADLADDVYTRKLTTAFDASIGGHIRHCLDHFRILLEAVPAGDLNYDHRDRGTLVETDRQVALQATRDLIAGYAKLDGVWLERPLRVTCKTSYSTSGSQTSGSTIGREIMYAIAHAVHHYALIGVMGGIMGLRMPAGFGIAPSTLQHQAETALAAG